MSSGVIPENPASGLPVSTTEGFAIIKPNYIGIEPSGAKGKTFTTGITNGASNNNKYDIFFDRTVWGKKIQVIPYEWTGGPSLRVAYYKQKS
jgi:hypothetical protein